MDMRMSKLPTSFAGKAALGRYASQQHRNYANPDYVWSLARTHGINVNREYAEVFEVSRVVA